jgi:hypothetical protein
MTLAEEGGSAFKMVSMDKTVFIYVSKYSIEGVLERDPLVNSFVLMFQPLYIQKYVDARS